MFMATQAVFTIAYRRSLANPVHRTEPGPCCSVNDMMNGKIGLVQEPPQNTNNKLAEELNDKKQLKAGKTQTSVSH